MRLCFSGWKVAMQGKSPGQSDCDQNPLGYSECGFWTSMASVTQELVAESQPHQGSPVRIGIFTRSQAAGGGGGGEDQSQEREVVQPCFSSKVIGVA